MHAPFEREVQPITEPPHNFAWLARLPWPRPHWCAVELDGEGGSYLPQPPDRQGSALELCGDERLKAAQMAAQWTSEPTFRPDQKAPRRRIYEPHARPWGSCQLKCYYVPASLPV